MNLIRIVFETVTIAPVAPPDSFMYTPSRITYSAVYYVAIVSGRSREMAMQDVKDCWPSAIIHSVEIGVEGFSEADRALDASVFGTMTHGANRQVSWVQRFWAHLWSHKQAKLPGYMDEAVQINPLGR